MSTTEAAPRAIEILLVEDNPADIRLTTEIFKQAKLRNTLHVAEDGETALAMLRDPARRKPDLVLLDLNLPGIDGREVLLEIKSDPALRAIPVCVLTTSAADQDISTAYHRHTNCYIVKPVDLNQFIRVVQQLEDFWFSVVKLPRAAP
ncbi:MAG TPA: response regulator [Kofleriaceae bacterium]|nr:response regulator [Kofleriaceae bacterium]